MQNPKLICPFQKIQLDFLIKVNLSMRINHLRYLLGIRQYQGVPNMRGGLEEEEKINFLEEAQSLPRQDSNDLDIPLIQEALNSDEFVLELTGCRQMR